MKREITFTSLLLSAILTILLGAANAYLGLKVGITISASIPAAVISMGILRLLKRSSILENNIVQTAASAGEALTAGIAFTLPALLFTDAIHAFHYWQTVLLASIGGILGVIFAIPLRRALINDSKLSFPEGTAIAKVLQTEESDTANIGILLKGSLISGLIALAQNGLKILASHLEIWFKAGGALFGLSLGFSPTLLGAGFIIGIEIGIAILSGIVIAWFIALPLLSHFLYSSSTLSHNELAHLIWQNDIRFIGVGCLLGTGIWSVVELLTQLLKQFFKRVGQYEKELLKPVETDRDIPSRWLTVMLVVFLALTYVFLLKENQLVLSHHSPLLKHLLALIGTGTLLILGFLTSAIIAYIVGMIGTSASPLSGLTLISLIIIGFLLSNLTKMHHDAMIKLTLVLTVLIGATAAISNDTMQDLKTGQLVGATPWRQELMLIFGVIVSALTLPLILNLLYQAYGFAQKLPRPGMDPESALLAPQANMMAAVAKGIIANEVPWHMMGLGLGLAIAGILVNRILLRVYGRRFPVLGMGLGIYLPLVASTPLMLGGLSHYFIKRRIRHLPKPKFKEIDQKLLLFACGIVAGSALMGVILAVPFMLLKSTDSLRIMPNAYEWLASVLILFTLAWLYHYATRKIGHIE